jgi:hypothetical protein
MPTIFDEARPTKVAGTKQDLDAATLWARAVLYSMLGPEQGETEFRKLPALLVLLTFRSLLDTGEAH